LKRFLRLAPFALLLPAVASASVVWKGDFETGNTSQWEREQSVSSSRLQVVSSPVRQGRYALKAVVRKGDDPIDASGNRNELLHLSYEPSGSEYFYKWSTFFPSSFPRSSRWQIFAQWHHTGLNGSPPLEFYIIDDVIHLRAGGVNGKVVYRAPLQRGKWNDYVLHVKWSADPRVGFVELYHNGKLALPKTKAATQFSGQRNYLKLGLYRDESITPEGVVFHDGFTIATKLEDVMPPPAVATPAPKPAPAPAPSTPAPVTTPDEAPASEQPAPIAEIPAEESGDGTLGTGGIIPEDPMLAGMTPAAGCGASSTGGTPLLVAAALAVVALLGRRKQAPAPVRARRSRSSRR
jgi:uncharacterized protein (TIGR03382 family)